MRPGRRAALAVLAFAPLVASAQAAGGRKRIALVGFDPMFEGETGLEAVARELARRGLVDGRQVEIVRVVIPAVLEEERGRGMAYLVPKIEQLVLPARPDVIVALGSIMTKGCALATREIPIVGSLADPVDAGVARSLARPGGNVTGVAHGAAESATKTIEFVRALVPRLSRLAIFHDARQMASRFAGLYERAARDQGLDPLMVPSIDAKELLRQLRDIQARRVQAGLWAWADGDPKEIAREALAARLPLVGTDEGQTVAGMLASYSVVDLVPAPKLAAAVEQILRGASPATIPFQFPQQFRLVINRRTASALKLAVPADLLLRADRVIE
jgi:putative ABC transport system substrate-binding protein